jgi:hypothetical protein
MSNTASSASAGVAGLQMTMPRSGRLSTAKAEYSKAIGPMIGCRNLADIRDDAITSPLQGQTITREGRTLRLRII